MSDNQFWTYFFKLYESIPRQGPGLDEYTARALSCLPPLGPEQRILDIGCGAGMQTLELARRTPARILATDLHEPFLELLKARVAKEGFEDRVSIQPADMAALPFEDGSFDVLWAEGSIFIIGFSEGLEKWRRLLKPGGYLVVSELTLFSRDLPQDFLDFCLPGGTEDASLEGRRRAIKEAGYLLQEDFVLPREGWWESFYLPLQERLEAFEQQHGDSPDAMAVIERSRYEIGMFQRYCDLYGYTFFIMKRG